MNILILTEGGRKTGFGHVSRSVALYQVCLKRKINCQILVNGDTSVNCLLKGINYKIKNWRKEKPNLHGIDGVIIDSYLASRQLYNNFSRCLGGNIVMIDDYKRISYPCGMVVNPSIGGDKLKYPQKKNIKYLLGKEYIILREEFWTVPKKNISKDVKNVLITFGGMNNVDLANKIINKLKAKFDLNFFTVGCGKNNLVAKNMIKFMLRADICICAGGQTVNELARVGVPTIGVCSADNQIMNLNWWQKRGFLEYVGWHNTKNLLNKISLAVEKLMSYNERVVRSQIGKDNVDGCGSLRIVKCLEENNSLSSSVPVRIRKAKIRDSRDLWSWRNNSKIRNWCFNTDKIAYNDHIRWFKNKLSSQDASFYIGENKLGEKIGQVRIDLDSNKNAYINVSLNPAFFGQGLGRHLITEASRVFLKENPNNNSILAEIFINNIASIKAFQKAGYIQTGQAVKDNRDIFIFTYKR